MKIYNPLVAGVLLPYEIAAQSTVSSFRGLAAFAEGSYEIGDRVEPALRSYSFGLIGSAGFGLGATYDVHERDAVAAFVGLGLGYAARHSRSPSGARLSWARDFLCALHDGLTR